MAYTHKIMRISVFLAICATCYSMPIKAFSANLYPDMKSAKNTASLDNYFLWKYVKAREEYYAKDMGVVLSSVASKNKNIIRLLSSHDEIKAYRNYMNPATNPKTPKALLGKEGIRVVETPIIKYLSNSGKKIAQINFTLTQQNKFSLTTKPKIAIIEYEYEELELNNIDRLVNPLGFRVLSYRISDNSLNGGNL